MKRKLLSAAKVVRSKNSGPFELTLDVMFKSRKYFDLFRTQGIITAESVAALYGVPESHVLGIVWFEPAHAVKVVLRRWQPSGAPGDRDVYGAQQHAPLLGLTFDA